MRCPLVWWAMIGAILPVARAQPDTPDAPPTAETPAEPSGQPEPEPGGVEELDSVLDVLFEDFEVVVTAGRRAQASHLTGVPVSVLTERQIHLSGATTVPQLLDRVPGVHVLQIDRNRYAVGVRGLHHEFSDRTLVLLDGRNAGSGLFGGVDFQRLPVFLEDLERIEVVRGPGGAVWGANAFNGVINMISKDPRDTQGVFLSTTLNEFGDVSTHARWGGSHKDLAWRVSLGYDEQETSEDAIIDDDFSSRDFSRLRRVNAEGVYDIDADSELRFGIGHSHVERGDFSFLGLQVGEDERLDYVRAFASYERALAGDRSLNLSVLTTVEDVNRPTLWRYNMVDSELNAQYQTPIGADHETIFGGSARVVRIDSNPYRDDMLLPDEAYDEEWLGAFVLDRWQADERLQIEVQGRVDYYSGTETDWSARLAGLYSLDEHDDRVVRLAAAKAFRAPQLAIREIETSRVPLPTPPFPAGTFGTELFRAGDLDNEQIYSLEAGYFGRYEHGVTVRADTYYQHYEDLTGARLLPDPFSAGRVLAELDNLGAARAWGAELELAVEGERSRASVWYAYHGFDYDMSTEAPNSRAFVPPEHSVGASGRVEFIDRLTGTASYRYTGVTEGDAVGTSAVPETHRLDLSLAWRTLDERLELAVGVFDVFDETALAVDAVGSPGGEFETPGRFFWLRLQAEF
ncbi:MAG: TonB-dependent receptor plug domain-containing protein [Phycisphaerales bacterium JB040]